ncbi:uncharacterized protein LOC121427675 [Lytechinus variegatus]|uniref:uncharacterized protein LOC121427675 n=1 Tax=Lytechinus variegatus TaxID=7654 RepID=UPI001BB1C18B|nr:uncharacterized protein LOC121427675 [Lytechinus variegatus]
MPVPLSVYSVLTPGVDFQNGSRTEDQRRERVRNVLKSPVVFLAVFFNLLFALFVLFVLSNYTREPPCDAMDQPGILTTPAAPIDKSFHRVGTYNHHHFDENCHYDHTLNILSVELKGDGYGENATIIYDFSRRLMTYKLTRKQICFLGVIDEVIDVEVIQDGDSVNLPETTGSNFTSSGVIPDGFLRLNTSPVVALHCANFETYWVEPVDASSRVRTVRHHTHTTTTTTTTTTSDGKTTTTTTTTTTSQQ